jgi:hypothetical protein
MNTIIKIFEKGINQNGFEIRDEVFDSHKDNFKYKPIILYNDNKIDYYNGLAYGRDIIIGMIINIDSVVGNDVFAKVYIIDEYLCRLNLKFETYEIQIDEYDY